MTMQQDRRDFIAGAATAAAGITAALAAGGSQRASAAQSAAGQECMTVLYQNGEGVSFDFDYYANQQMPLLLDRYGASIARIELRRGQPGANGAPPPYIATVTIWIADGAAFDAAAAQHQAQIAANIPRFTNATVIAQRDRILAAAP